MVTTMPFPEDAVVDADAAEATAGSDAVASAKSNAVTIAVFLGDVRDFTSRGGRFTCFSSLAGVEGNP
jgi:hypothetical protein